MINRFPSGSYHKLHTNANGKKVRLTISPEGRILDSVPVNSRVNRTRTGKRLAARRRRIS